MILALSLLPWPDLRRAALAVLLGLAGLGSIAHAGNITSVEQVFSVATDGFSAGDLLGSAVATDGTTAVIGAPNDSSGPGAVQGAGSAYVFVKVAGAWTMEAKLRAADLSTSAQFGSAVALSGNTVAVSAISGSSATSPVQAVYVFTRSAGVWTQQTKIDGPTAGAAFDARFGQAVALAGDTLLAGTRRTTGAGAAYVFTRSGTTWAQQALLTPADGQTADFFGASVAIEGGTAVVGARQAGLPAKALAGAAYVFTRSDSTWTQQAKLTAGDAAAQDTFGYSVAISGGTVLAGAPAAGGTVAHSGAGYVFTSSGGVWSQQGKLTLTSGTGAFSGQSLGYTAGLSGDVVLLGQNPQFNDIPRAWLFGRAAGVWSYTGELYQSAGSYGTNSVAVAGAEVLIGAPSLNSIYDFTLAGGSWSAAGRLPAPTNDREFGSAVDVQGNTAVVSAPTDTNASGAFSGSVYVFTRTGTTWTQQAKLTPSDGRDKDRFGSAVALDGDTLVVTSFNNYGYDWPGKAYVFVRTGTTWTQQALLVPSDGSSGQSFGLSAGLSGNTLVVGCPYHWNATDDYQVGEAYIFTRTGSTWSETKHLAPSTLTVGSAFGSTVAIEGSTVLVASPGEAFTASESGFVHIFQGSGSSWALKKKLRPAGAGIAVFGNGIALSGSTMIVDAQVFVGVPAAGNMTDCNYFYTGSGGTWSQQAAIKPPGDEGLGSLGVALSGNYAVLGPLNTLFVRSGSTWTPREDLGYSALRIDGDTVVAGTGYPTNPGNAVALRLTSDIIVLDGATASAPQIADDVPLGHLALGMTATHTFTLRNDGIALLTGIAVSVVAGDDAADVKLILPKAASLAANATTTFTVTYKPLAVGDRSTSIQVASSDPDQPKLVFSVSSTVTATPEPPQILTQPQSYGVNLAQAGADITLSVEATGTQNLVYQWKKNGVAIKGANTSSLLFPAANKKDGGSYTVTVSNKWGSVTSNPPALLAFALGATDTTPAIPVTVVAGKTLTLTAPIFGAGTINWTPPGDASPMQDDANTSGTQTAKLVIKAATPADAGNFNVYLFDSPSENFLVATYSVTVIQKPVIDLPDYAGLGTWQVSAAPAFLPSFNNSPTRYYASGLPPGVTLDPLFGQLNGSPTVAGFYTMRLWAANAAGSSVPWEVQVSVSPIALDIPGTYAGLIDADDVLNQGLGGRLTMTVTTAGSFSGSLTLGTLTHAFTGRLDRTQSDDGSPDIYSGLVPLGRAPDGRLLHLEFQMGGDSNSMGGQVVAVALDGEQDLALTAYHHADYSLQTTDQRGRHNVLISASAGSSAPAGTGYAFFTVDAKGTGTLAMKLADGTSVTAAGPLGTNYTDDDTLPVHALLYGNTGSIHGLAAINADDNSVNGSLRWFKDPSYVRSASTAFAAGWNAAAVTLSGTLYQPPFGTNLLGVPDADGNARLYAPPISSSSSQPGLYFWLRANNTAVMPTRLDNPCGTTFAINPANGLFIGTFTLVDSDPVSGKPISRKVTYQGLYVPGSYDTNSFGFGGGFALVPPLPSTGFVIIIGGGPTGLQSVPLSLSPVFLH